MISQNQNRWLVSASILGLAVSLPGLAMAQAAAPAGGPSAAAAPSNQIQEVVVTAQKRPEALQRTAIAASAATGEDLVRQGISTVVGLSTLSPSIKITAIREQTQVYVRGIGSSISASNADPAVSINVNGVYIPAEMSGGSFFDLERVEVLPGPQGTLYGRNAAGGAVNVISKRPGHTFGGEAYAEYGSFNAVNAFGAVNLPVSDSLAFRVAAISQRHDGYVDGLNGSKSFDQDSINTRASVLFTPGSRTSIYGTISYGHDGGVPNSDQNNPVTTGDPWKAPVDFKPLGLYTDYKTWLGSVQLDQKLNDDITFTYLAGYGRLQGSQTLELFQTGPATVYAPLQTTSVTNEARLAGNIAKFNWVGGLYEYDSTANYLALAALPVPQIYNGPFHQHANGYAGFGQVTYTVTDSLRLTGGLRYSYDRKTLTGTNTTVVSPTVHSGVSYNGASSYSRPDWKIGAEYDLAHDSLLYASIQTGYNQGGFSSAPVQAGSTAAAPYAPATLLAYTIGSKNRFFDRRVQVNLEGFYYDYSNYQVSARNLLTGQNQIFNAAKATTYGLQIDTRFLIASADQLDAGVTLLHAEANTLFVPPATNLNGYALPFSPTTTVNASYQHTWSLSSGARVEGLVSTHYVSDLWATYNHAAGTLEPGYAKFDASVTWRPPADRWSIALWSRNLGNKATFGGLNGGALPGPAAGFLEAPRTYGVRVDANF